MANLLNTTISGTGHITMPAANTFQRTPELITTIVRWTTGGITVLRGNTPTASNSSWTCPTGVSNVEVLVVGGGGGGGSFNGGGGGGGGVVYRANYPVTPGQSYSVIVGNGGVGDGRPGNGATGANGAVGTTGQDSVFSIAGANLITDPTISSGIGGWASYNSSLTWFNSNSLRTTSTAGNPAGATYNFSCVVGKTYYFRADVTQSGAITNDARIQISGIGLARSHGQSTSADTTTVFDYFTATSTTHILEVLLYNSQNNALLTIDNVAIYNVTDNCVATGGGYGGGYSVRLQGGNGGSGGGSWGTRNGGIPLAGQGFIGGGGNNVGSNYNESAGGGGGAGGKGGDGQFQDQPGGGGPGLAFDISGTLTYYGGGGGAGANRFGGTTAGGLGGGGRGGTTGAQAGIAGTAGTGGGGGGSAYNATPGASGTGGAGGSGVVILRYQQTATGSDIRGSLRYNTDLTGLEVYENHIAQWNSQDNTKNFGGHNLLTNSNLRGNDLGVEAIWTKTNNSTDVAAPDGSALTTKCVSGTSGNSFFWQTGSISYKTNTTYTESVWVRVASGTGSLLFNNGVNASQTINPTATFQRFSFTYTTTASAGPVYYLGFSTPSPSTTFYFWGWQLEEGVTSPGPYVVTNTAPSPAPGIVGNYRIHQYTTTGISGFTPAVSGSVEVLVVGGGGKGGNGIYGSGGGGAGGVIHNRNYPVIAGKSYSVSVGAGATIYQGNPSWFGSLYAVGGGGSGGYGGSGGGGGHSNPGHPGGGGTVGQGFPGGYHVYSTPYPCGGGGGAGGKGGDGNTSGGPGPGGPGIAVDITGAVVYYGGGGGGTNYNAAGAGLGGIGGGGNGVWAGTGVAGTANTGGGGGAGGGNGVSGDGGAGGSGIVVVRYRYN